MSELNHIKCANCGSPNATIDFYAISRSTLIMGMVYYFSSCMDCIPMFKNIGEQCEKMGQPNVYKDLLKVDSGHVEKL